jgi:diguanylate cyclase (GGDEF)-like protein/PAS domain S-box-containing protein
VDIAVGIMKNSVYKYSVLIIGGGCGGSALLGMFVEDKSIEVLGVSDKDPNAPGLSLARSYGIPVYHHNYEAMHACKDYTQCIVYNLTGDDAVSEQVKQVMGGNPVATGLEARLFWQMVTSLKQLKNDLERSQNHLQEVINNVLDGIITVSDSGLIRGFNPAAEDILGYSEQEVLGKSVEIFLPESKQGEYVSYLEHFLNASNQRGAALRSVEVVGCHKGGEEFPMEFSLSGARLNGQHFFTAIVRDITERKLSEQRLAHLAHHDYLTGLPNRALFLDRLEYSMSLARRGDYQIALFFLDLDGFKSVNDAHGHEVGDELLKVVARCFQTAVRPSDTVARMGGDEFIFLLNNIGNKQNAAGMANKILHALERPFVIEGVECSIGASIGVSFFDGGNISPEMLLKQADKAMYLAKDAGKNTFRFMEETF